MAKKYFKPLSLGNGKHCYSGPECRIHGKTTAAIQLSETKQNAVPVLSPEILKNFAIQAQENYQITKEEFNQFVCNKSIDIDNAEELGEDMFLPGNSAAYCSEHECYHVYSRTAAHEIIARGITKKASQIVAKLKLNDKIIGRHIPILLTESKKYSSELQDEVVENKKTLLELLEQVPRNTDLYNIALQRREDYRTENREMTLRFSVKKEEYNTPLRLKAHEIPSELLLEYWQCGRKRPYVSLEEAKSFIVKAKDDELSSYSCPHCKQTHNGHGDGKAPIEDQLVRAEEHWNMNAQKANSFLNTKNL